MKNILFRKIIVLLPFIYGGREKELNVLEDIFYQLKMCVHSHLILY